MFCTVRIGALAFFKFSFCFLLSLKSGTGTWNPELYTKVRNIFHTELYTKIRNRNILKNGTESIFKISFVNATWCNLQSCINCLSILHIIIIGIVKFKYKLDKNSSFSDELI
ncbi:hypothetical protein BpHYR1_019651 [Brachionus plicatilis]|uniref:Secreted protein n=1 Tax=Brachionus plicatilis TaxID=10195 RepID=A0A3M7Q8A5_BRAPC|nr:hypothetical protein BpHYR1_019651 [Brachionus plicatilis]